MTFRDTIDLALRNLGQAKLRTSLTTLGVSIGIASLAGMVSLGVGLQDQIVGRFLQSGVFDAITVINPSVLGAPGALLAGRGGLRGRGGLADATRLLTQEDPPPQTIFRIAVTQPDLVVVNVTLPQVRGSSMKPLKEK